VRRTIVLVFVVTLLAAGAYADVFGSALIQRSGGPYGSVDTCVGCLFAYYPVPAADVGQTLDDWGFYADQGSSAGNVITPMLFLALPNDYFEVAAIGATQTSTGPGVQTYSFGPFLGSAVLVAGEYLGWRDGTPDGTKVNPGTISFDDSGQGMWYAGNGSYSGSIAVGQDIQFTQSVDTPIRTYSVNGSTVPEPARSPKPKFGDINASLLHPGDVAPYLTNLDSSATLWVFVPNFGACGTSMSGIACLRLIQIIGD
jgi:hypothetical protein